MIKTDVQIITSPYTKKRWNKLKNDYESHLAFDIRSVSHSDWRKMAVIFPEDCQVTDIIYEKKWGYTIKYKSINSEYSFQATHCKPEKNIKIGKTYKKNEIIGYTDTTDYMKQNNYYEHLHFAVYENEKPINPYIYFKANNIKYEYKNWGWAKYEED